jgi:exoribonuclease-2
MIAANTCTTKFLEANGFPTIRRVVKTPERWQKLVNLAEQEGYAARIL